MLTALATCPSRRFSVWCSWMNSLARVMTGRLGVILLHHHLVAQHGEVLGEDGQQFDHGFVLLARHDPGVEIGLLQFRGVHVHSPFADQPHRALELGPGGRLAKHLAGLQEADQPVAQPHRHGGVAQARRAAHGMGFLRRARRQSLLHLQAGGASAARLQHHRAEGALVALAVMRELPRFHRPQRHRQTRGFGERPLVILEYLGVAQRLDQVPVGIGPATGAWLECRLLSLEAASALPPPGLARSGGSSPRVSLRALPNKCCLHWSKLREDYPQHKSLDGPAVGFVYMNSQSQ